MGLFNLFRRKHKLTQSENQLMDQMANMLFGGLDQMREQINELYDLLNHRYSHRQVANALTWMTSHFSHSEDKSSQSMVDEGQMMRRDNPFSREDALTIYNFVVNKHIAKMFPGAPAEVLNAMFVGLGNSEDGASTDVIPGAYGEYGFCLTNPIPTKGIPANEVYLRRLALLSGEPFHWERIGSFGAPNIKHPIDAYEIISESGKTLCTIYISPYQKVISNKAPKGFYLR